MDCIIRRSLCKLPDRNGKAMQPISQQKILRSQTAATVWLVALSKNRKIHQSPLVKRPELFEFRKLIILKPLFELSFWKYFLFQICFTHFGSYSPIFGPVLICEHSHLRVSSSKDSMDRWFARGKYSFISLKNLEQGTLKSYSLVGWMF